MVPLSNQTGGVAPGAHGTPLPTGVAKLTAVQQMFDGVAPRYELVNKIMTFGMDRSWRRQTIRRLALRPGSRILDLACGTGDFARDLEADGMDVVGVDVSEGMLRAAHGVRELVMADGAAIPVRDGYFDGVVCGFAVRNFADLEATLAECARVLRPRGRLALLEVDIPQRDIVRLGHRLWFNYGTPIIGALLSEREAYRYLPRSVAYLPDPNRMATMLGDAGFIDVERRSLLLGSVQIVTATRSGSYGIVEGPNTK